MRKMMRFVLGCAVLFAVATAAQAQVELKAGGSMLFDPSRWGGHVSVEIPIGSTYPTYLSPFLEFYRDNDPLPGADASQEIIPAGVNILYKAPFSQRYGVVYFGVGGGMYWDSRTLFGESKSKIDPMVTAGGGLQFDINEAFAGFVQGRWVRAFTSGSENDVSISVGLSFKMGTD